jgi:hypothetical protein
MLKASLGPLSGKYLWEGGERERDREVPPMSLEESNKFYCLLLSSRYKIYSKLYSKVNCIVKSKFLPNRNLPT